MDIHTLLLVVMTLLSGWIIHEDQRKLEVPAIPVLALATLGLIVGVFFPLPGLTPDHALWGATLGLAIAVVTRAYIHLRVGIPAFGGADIALITGAGGLIGPFLLGPWLLATAVVGVILMLVAPLLTHSTDIDGEKLHVLPFCPTLILSAAITYSLALTGWIPALAGT